MRDTFTDYQRDHLSRATVLPRDGRRRRFARRSYKGGAPGFVRVVDEPHARLPDYDGNGMYRRSGNMLVNPKVGLLFIDFDAGRGSA